jgi:hypothetical protein
MGWREKRMKRLTNRRAYCREVSEFFAGVMMDPANDKDEPLLARCRLRLDELDQESMYLEGSILRLQNVK